MKHKKLFISLTAVLTVFVFLGIFLLIWFVGDSYDDFKKFRKEFEIEGLEDGAVPQGITAYPANYTDGVDDNGKPITKQQQYFLTSAYMKDGSPSRIYVLGEKTGYVGYVTMVNLDGTPHKGHVGGVATNGTRLWVAYGNSVLVAKASEDYSKENILREIIDKAEKNRKLEEGIEEDADENEEATETSREILSIQFTASFKANCNVSFLYYSDDSRYTGTTYDRLYVGEFYRKGNYETDKSHHLKTPKGYKNTAFMYEYNIDGSNTSNPYGLTRLDSTLKNTNITEENNVPKIQKIYSLPEKVQGIAFSRRTGYSTNDGVLVLSQSYGLANSHLLCFDWNTVNGTSNRTLYRQITGYSFEYDGVFITKQGDTQQTPYTDSGLYVYYVDKANSDMFVKDYSIPSMSEGMCIVTPYGSNDTAVGRIFVLFESGSKKYNMFTRENIKNVYSFIPNVYKVSK